ncbi:unnamed protein product [Mytilus edulis]|uniref:C2H2-type domain-containing protein n=1 Tax=Mytilus edulis TaxID=6550 RepID=A0A8S3QAH8_MYTED|nr:unnamed protein product [Mytilus edulis]
MLLHCFGQNSSDNFTQYVPDNMFSMKFDGEVELDESRFGRKREYHKEMTPGVKLRYAGEIYLPDDIVFGTQNKKANGFSFDQEVCVYNYNVFELGQEVISLKYRPKLDNPQVKNYIPCIYCNAFYKRDDLWRHQKTCNGKKGQLQGEALKIGAIKSGTFLLPTKDEYKNLQDNVISKMKEDDIKTAVLGDPVVMNFGIDIKEYSYSEPQAGKSYCDSKIAHMRTKMKTFVASGKDIITAKDMKVAIDDGSGVVGCQVAYVTVDSTKQTLTSHKWKGVNAYTDIKYEVNGIRVYRAHGIGTGSFLSHAEINKLTSSFQEDTKLVVHEDFSLPSKIEGKIKVQLNAEQDTVVPPEELAVENIATTTVVSIPDAQIFSCPETGCVKII